MTSLIESWASRYRISNASIVLGLILGLGLLLRLYSIEFGLPALNDPDELMFELGAIKMLRSQSLNPGWFGHPATTTMYALAVVNIAVLIVGKALGWFATIKAFASAAFANPTYLILPGRVVMALFGVGSAWLTHRIAQAMFGPRVAWVAALIVALSPVAIWWGQVIRSDVMATVFLQLSLLAVLRYYRAPSRRDFLVAAVWLGVAIATKWPFALGVTAMGAAIAAHAMQGAMPPRLTLPKAAARFAAFGLLVVTSLIATSPYIALSYETVLRNLSGEAQLHHLGATGGTALENAWWYISGPLRRGLGMAGLGLAFAGCFLMLSMKEARIIVVPPVVAFVIVLCSQRLVWERWALPLLPFLAMGAGVALLRLAEMIERRFSAIRGVILPIAALLVMAPLFLADIGQARGRLNDTRQRASAWAIANIPTGSSVMIEHFGFDLYTRPWRVLFPLGDLGCVDAKMVLKGQIDYSVIDRARAGRSNIDYGTMPRQRAETCSADYAILTQYDRYAAERGDFPAEYAAYQTLLAQAQTIAVFAPEPRQSSGPVVRIIKFRHMPQ